jgi:hypothetical protein
MNRFMTFSALLLIGMMLIACSSAGEPVVLDWKIADGEVLAYATAMNPVEKPTFSLNIENLFGGDGIPEEVKGQLSSITLPQTASLISILERNARNNITVKMIVDSVTMGENPPEDALSESMNQLMQRMVGTVQIQGEITPEGSIASFYLEQRQRNLLALFFELPSQPVRVGDKWALDMNCIEMGSGFAVNNAERINQVEFTALSSTPEGKPIAVLDYLIVESVDGTFVSAGSPEGASVAMTCSFVGQGQFLIEEGRWHQLTGEMAINSTGLMAANGIQPFALMPLAEVPQQYIDMK